MGNRRSNVKRLGEKSVSRVGQSALCPEVFLNDQLHCRWNKDGLMTSLYEGQWNWQSHILELTI